MADQPPAAGGADPDAADASAGAGAGAGAMVPAGAAKTTHLQRVMGRLQALEERVSEVEKYVTRRAGLALLLV